MYDLEYFLQIEKEEEEQANRLATILIDKYNPKSVIDFGCATGLYLYPFQLNGIHTLGLDYMPILTSISKINNLILTDLRQPYKAGHFDLALCLEVLEHIESKYENIMLKNISDASDIIIFTAAVPGQGGEGHVNMQPKKYWEKKFKDFGYRVDKKSTEQIVKEMLGGYHLGRFTNNLQVMIRED